MHLVALVRASCLVLIAIMISGCGDGGPKVYKVTGLVSHKGKPLPYGSVTFICKECPLVGGVIRSDGTYELNAYAGTQQVAITAMPPIPEGTNPFKDGYNPPPSIIPTKYNRITTSGLSFEVRPDSENLIDIELP